MKTNQIFSIQRFGLYLKHSFIISQKGLTYYGVGILGFLLIYLLFKQNLTEIYTIWDSNRYWPIFMFFSIFSGATYFTQSFPAFRSKEKTMSFLTLPVSNTEKFVFELVRVVMFYLMFPIAFWLVANASAGLSHYLNPLFQYHAFSYSEMTAGISLSSWTGGIAITGSLFVVSLLIAGAAIFVKSPFVKMGFAIFLILLFNVIIAIFLVKTIGISQNRFIMDGRHSLQGESAAIVTQILAGLSIFLFSIAFFKLKEKEV